MAILNHHIRSSASDRAASSWWSVGFSLVNRVTSAAVLCLLLLTGLWAGGRKALAQAAPLPEKQVKAAFLINFPKYVEWPSSAFAQTNSPIVVASLGETELGNEIRQMIQGRSIHGRSIVFKVINEADSIEDCHILFVPESARRRISTVLEKLKGSSVLSVGESDDFLGKGGVINLARREQKVRLEVNLTSAQQAGLKISSKLLSVADVVKGK